MDFLLSEEQLELRRSIIKFAKAELGDGVDKRDSREEFYRVGWKRCANFGLTGIGIPEEYGGGGADSLTLMVALEALGFGSADRGLVFALANHLLSCAMPIVTWGTPWQKSKYLPALASGRMVGAHAMTEAQAGSDTAAIFTSARRHGSKFVLNGRKMFITNAPIADVVLVFAKTATDDGLANFSAFIVEKTLPGFFAGGRLSKLGLRTAPMAEIWFDDCEVSEECLLGPVGNGALVFATAAEWERGYLSACNLGVLKRDFEACLSFVRKRRQFGTAIGQFQAVAHKLADIQVNIELAQLMLYKLAWLRKAGKPTFFESAMAKLFVSESWVQGNLAMMQIHGAHGYMTGSGIERSVRDSLASTIYAGTSEIQREIIADWLGLNSNNQLRNVRTPGGAMAEQHGCVVERPHWAERRLEPFRRHSPVVE